MCHSEFGEATEYCLLLIAYDHCSAVPYESTSTRTSLKHSRGTKIEGAFDLSRAKISAELDFGNCIFMLRIAIFRPLSLISVKR